MIALDKEFASRTHWWWCAYFDFTPSGQYCIPLSEFRRRYEFTGFHMIVSNTRKG
jgi:hypothetical protein